MGSRLGSRHAVQRVANAGGNDLGVKLIMTVDINDFFDQLHTVMANVNSPGQIVISGAAENIKKAMEAATAAGASRAIPLQVSGAFHSPLMQPAVEGMVSYLDATTFETPSIPVIGNTTGSPMTTIEAVKTELRNQLTSPVQWQRTIEYMVDQGVSDFVEIGPGKVLTGLIRRINKEVQTSNIGDLEAVKGLGDS